MRKAKMVVQGYKTVTCLGQEEALKAIKRLNAGTWVDQAYQGDGYVGFNLETGGVADHPGPTTITLYELPRDQNCSLGDLRNHFWQNWSRLQIEIEDRVKSFYVQNYEIT
ncbi:MAG: hypothetical protein ACLFVG_09540 [Candidatus Aminicenantes bacterium]